MSGFKEGVGDVTRSAIGGIGDGYYAMLRGDSMPVAHLTGDMVTVQPGEEAVQSMGAALREHQAMEEADHRAAAEAMEADRQAGMRAQAPQPDMGMDDPDIG